MNTLIKTGKGAGEMPKIIDNLEENLLSAARRLIAEHGYDSDAEINVVWVYISYLRKKLVALDANIQIKAARNAGYSLEEIYDKKA